MDEPQQAKAEDKRPKRRHRSPHGMGLFVTDAELIEYLGVPYKTASEAIMMLDRDRGSGFPRKQKLWGDRRYLPAVQHWFDRMNGLSPKPSQPTGT